ncbi:MAG: hypothetical protein AAFQ16_10835, partial [Pseudomonadota bacterium]
SYLASSRLSHEARTGTYLFFNRHTYVYRNGDDSVVCEIESGYLQIDLACRRDSTGLASFELRDIRSVKIDGAPGDESMTVHFLSDHLADFVLFLKPTIRVEWSNPSRIVL